MTAMLPVTMHQRNNYASSVPFSEFDAAIVSIPIDATKAREEEELAKPVQKLFSWENLLVVALMTGWFLCSSMANNTAKALLNEYPFPLTATEIQFGFNALCCLLLSHTTGLIPPIYPTKEYFRATSPLGMSNLVGMSLTHLSLRYVPVSFTHTIKATSPVSTVLFSRLMLGSYFTELEMLSLLPIMGGVALCTLSEINFHLFGFSAAVLATLVFSFQNTYSKKIFGANMHHGQLLFYVSASAFVLLLPVFVLMDGLQLLLYPPEVRFVRVLTYLFLNCVFHFGQNMCAFWVLTKITPLSYAVANTVKRVFVIVSSVIWFGNAVSLWSQLGIVCALLGLYMYNAAKLQKKERLSKWQAHKRLWETGSHSSLTVV